MLHIPSMSTARKIDPERGKRIVHVRKEILRLRSQEDFANVISKQRARCRFCTLCSKKRRIDIVRPSLTAPVMGRETGQDIFNHGIAGISVSWIIRRPATEPRDVNRVTRSGVAPSMKVSRILALPQIRTGLLPRLSLSPCRLSSGRRSSFE